MTAYNSIKGNSWLGKLMKQFEMRKQTTTMSQRKAIAKFDLNKLRYYDDKKFPFRLLIDIPKLLEKTVDKIRDSSFNQSKIGIRNVGMFDEL